MGQVKGDSSVAGAAAVFGTSFVARGVEGHSTKQRLKNNFTDLVESCNSIAAVVCRG